MASLYEHDIYRPLRSTVPLGLIWITILVALAYAEARAVVPQWVLVVVGTPMAFVALLHCVHSLLRLRWSARTYGGHLPGFMRRMISLFPRLARFRIDASRVLLHLALAVFSVLLAFSTGSYSVLLPCALLFGIATTALLRVVLPPAVVYLASSAPDRIRFLARLNNHTPYGLAALLEVSNLANPDQEGFLGNTIGLLNDFRTTDANDWQEVVKQLIEMAAFVVVDAQDQSPGVEYEVTRILRNRLEFKTAFLSADRTLPSLLSRLEANSTHPSGAFMLMTPDEAMIAVPMAITQARTFWIPVSMDA